MQPLRAPFPYFGGKSRIAAKVWERLGADVTNYVEPFFGSGAVLLARPGWTQDVTWTETINDKSGFVANFWRAVQHDPEAVAHFADWPVNENDLHARHAWLVQNHLDTLPQRLEGDPDFYDAKIAGWWVWGACCWIGSGWCSGRGPWQAVETEDGRQLVHLGDAGMGVNRKLVHLGDAGMGVNRQLAHLGSTGAGVNGKGNLDAWIAGLSARLRRVRVACGDWTRITTPSVTERHGTTGVFLDPPYADTANRAADIYEQDDLTVAHDVRAWAIAHGDDPNYRIALCGYDTEHGAHMPADWTPVNWKSRGGYGSQSNGAGRANRHRETIWFSPHCLEPDRPLIQSLFDDFYRAEATP